MDFLYYLPYVLSFEPSSTNMTLLFCAMRPSALQLPSSFFISAFAVIGQHLSLRCSMVSHIHSFCHFVLFILSHIRSRNRRQAFSICNVKHFLRIELFYLSHDLLPLLLSCRAFAPLSSVRRGAPYRDSPFQEEACPLGTTSRARLAF